MQPAFKIKQIGEAVALLEELQGLGAPETVVADKHRGQIFVQGGGFLRKVGERN